MGRPKAAALKGVQVYTNYCNGQNGRSQSEIGIMKLALDGIPAIVREDKLSLTEEKAGKVYRVEITDTLVEALTKRFPVPSGSTAVVSAINAISASVKNAGVYNAAGTHTVHRLYLAAAYILLAHKHAAKQKDGVVALVVDKTGNIVSWGMKNPNVFCWHGETSAIIRLRGQLPVGGGVFSTLKPCKMCGGLISDASKRKIGAYHGQHDSGDDALKTALDRDKHNFPLDAHKGPALPRGLVLPIGASSAKVPLGERLQSDFKAQQGSKGGVPSPIVYVTSDAANELMTATKELFKAKLAKYTPAASQPATQNANTRAAVLCLASFLEQQGVKIR